MVIGVRMYERDLSLGYNPGMQVETISTKRCGVCERAISIQSQYR